MEKTAHKDNLSLDGIVKQITSNGSTLYFRLKPDRLEPGKPSDAPEVTVDFPTDSHVSGIGLAPYDEMFLGKIVRYSRERQIEGVLSSAGYKRDETKYDIEIICGGKNGLKYSYTRNNR